MNQGTEAQRFLSGPTLKEPALVHAAVSAAHCSPVPHFPETRPPLSGERNDLEPPARTMGATSLASRWKPSNLPESVLNTISQARAPSTKKASMPLSGLSSSPGVLPAAQIQFYVT